MWVIRLKSGAVIKTHITIPDVEEKLTTWELAILNRDLLLRIADKLGVLLE